MSEGHDDHGHGKQGFISNYIFSFDHKMIGKQYLTLAMVMALVGGLLAMLIRVQLGWPGTMWPSLETFFPAGMASGIMTPEFYVMLFTMHGTIMVFFVLSLGPVSGFGNFLIPLQIGARDMAFPFLNMLSFWTVLPGAIIILISFLRRGRRRGLRLDGLSAAVRDPLRHPRLRYRADSLARGDDLLRGLVHDGRSQLRRHHPEHAGEGAQHDAPAAHDLGPVRRRRPGSARLSRRSRPAPS